MTGRYDRSPANLRALRDRLMQAAKREGVVFGRLQQHMAVLVVTQFMGALRDEQHQPLMLVKGGASLELRLGISASRTSKDIDAVTRSDVETVHSRLAEVCAAGWEGFTAVLTPPVSFEVPGLFSQPFRFTAKLSYQGKPFTSVPIEVSAVEVGNADHHDIVASEALALVGIPVSAPVPCMTLPWQIAQKLHACTDPVQEPRTNDRAHDLVDLQLIEALIGDGALADTHAACRAVFLARGKHNWPPTVAARPHWAPIYARALDGLDELGLAPTLDDAVDRVQALVRRIVASSV
jgi:hypothetical protein